MEESKIDRYYMNNEIGPDWSSQELAVALKGIGFDVFTQSTWTHWKKSNGQHSVGWEFTENSIMRGTNSTHGGNDVWEVYSAPTHEIVMKWLWENYQIWVEVSMNDDSTWGYMISRIVADKRWDGGVKWGWVNLWECRDSALREAIDKIKSGGLLPTP
jgi:hypothetical protein